MAVALDSQYVIPAAVTLRSLCEHLEPSAVLCVHLLHFGLSDEDRARLRKVLDHKVVEVCEIALDGARFSDLPTYGHVSAAAYARLVLPRVLPETIDSVIYLDSDVLVLGDVSELWASADAAVPCQAAIDVSCPVMDASKASGYENCCPYLAAVRPIPNYQEFGFSPSDPYLNSGVLVLNLDAWRRDKLSEEAMDVMMRHKNHVLFWDQYALNVVLHGRWQSLDPSWNQGSQIYAYPDWQRSPFDFLTLARCRFEPKIVHFTSATKPWHYGCRHPYTKMFFEFLDRTPWAGWRPAPPWTVRCMNAARAGRRFLRRLVPLGRMG